MNETIKILQNHGTIRNFDPSYQISSNLLDKIIRASKQAPSWMNGQAYSITIFSDKEKEKLSKLVGTNENQDNNATIIKNSSLFLMFNIDLSLYGTNLDLEGEVEPLLIGSVDASLALQNALVASESLELGTCVIGGIRRISDLIIEEYNYHKYVFPLMGLAIGRPLDKKFVKPRISDILNVNRNSLKVNQNIELEKYSKKLQIFSEEAGYISSDWQSRFKHYYGNKLWPQSTREALKKQGLI